jgi:hypothetical protein
MKVGKVNLRPPFTLSFYFLIHNRTNLSNKCMYVCMPTMLKNMSEDMLGHVEDYVRRHTWTC